MFVNLIKNKLINKINIKKYNDLCEFNISNNFYNLKQNSYSIDELKELGIKVFGKNIKISKFVNIYNPTNLILHDNIRIDDFTILSCKGSIEIFNNVHISTHCFITSSTKIIIGKYSGISSGTKVFGSSDDYSGNFLTGPTIPSKYLNVQNGDIIIKNHVVIGSNSVIMPNITIEEGTAIGVNSFINKNTDEWKIYAGSPIKFIKNREKNCLKLQKLLELNN